MVRQLPIPAGPTTSAARRPLPRHLRPLLQFLLAAELFLVGTFTVAFMVISSWVNDPGWSEFPRESESGFWDVAPVPIGVVVAAALVIAIWVAHDGEVSGRGPMVKRVAIGVALLLQPFLAWAMAVWEWKFPMLVFGVAFLVFVTAALIRVAATPATALGDQDEVAEGL
jgi:hypothetical protein